MSSLYAEGKKLNGIGTLCLHLKLEPSWATIGDMDSPPGVEVQIDDEQKLLECLWSRLENDSKAGRGDTLLQEPKGGVVVK